MSHPDIRSRFSSRSSGGRSGSGSDEDDDNVDQERDDFISRLRSRTRRRTRRRRRSSRDRDRDDDDDDDDRRSSGRSGTPSGSQSPFKSADGDQEAGPTPSEQRSDDDGDDDTSGTGDSASSSDPGDRYFAGDRAGGDRAGGSVDTRPGSQPVGNVDQERDDFIKGLRERTEARTQERRDRERAEQQGLESEDRLGGRYEPKTIDQARRLEAQVLEENPNLESGDLRVFRRGNTLVTEFTESGLQRAYDRFARQTRESASFFEHDAAPGTRGFDAADAERLFESEAREQRSIGSDQRIQIDPDASDEDISRTLEAHFAEEIRQERAASGHQGQFSPSPTRNRVDLDPETDFTVQRESGVTTRGRRTITTTNVNVQLTESGRRKILKKKLAARYPDTDPDSITFEEDPETGETVARVEREPTAEEQTETLTDFVDRLEDQVSFRLGAGSTAGFSETPRQIQETEFRADIPGEGPAAKNIGEHDITKELVSESPTTDTRALSGIVETPSRVQAGSFDPQKALNEGVGVITRAARSSDETVTAVERGDVLLTGFGETPVFAPRTEDPGEDSAAEQIAEEVYATPVAIAGGAANLPVEVAEFGARGIERTLEGEGREFAEESGQTALNVGSVAATTALENPQRTGIQAVISLPFTYAAMSAIPKSRFLIQPGEEAAGIGGHAATRAIAGTRTADRLFPGKEPLIFSEEAAIRAGKRAAAGARERAGKAKRAVRGIRGRYEIEPRAAAGPVPPKLRKAKQSTKRPRVAEEELRRFERATAVRRARERSESRFITNQLEAGKAQERLEEPRSVSRRESRTVSRREPRTITERGPDTTRSGPTEAQMEAYRSRIKRAQESELDQEAATEGVSEDEITRVQPVTGQDTRQRVGVRTREGLDIAQESRQDARQATRQEQAVEGAIEPEIASEARLERGRAEAEAEAEAEEVEIELETELEPESEPGEFEIEFAGEGPEQYRFPEDVTSDPLSEFERQYEAPVATAEELSSGELDDEFLDAISLDDRKKKKKKKG